MENIGGMVNNSEIFKLIEILMSYLKHKYTIMSISK